MGLNGARAIPQSPGAGPFPFIVAVEGLSPRRSLPIGNGRLYIVRLSAGPYRPRYCSVAPCRGNGAVENEVQMAVAIGLVIFTAVIGSHGFL
jgi:hypothetical protein